MWPYMIVLLYTTFDMLKNAIMKNKKEIENGRELLWEKWGIKWNSTIEQLSLFKLMIE